MKSVLYVVEDKNTAQYRYRVKNVIEAVSKSKHYTARYILKKDYNAGLLDGVDLVVLERQTAKDNRILALIKDCKKKGIKVLFDIDDLVFDYKYLSLIRSIGGKSYLYWVGYLWGIRRIAKRVDGFIVTNEFLGKKLRDTFGKSYTTIRNSLNNEQIEKAKQIKKKDNSGFVIGYFSGSPTHEKDFQLIEPQLIRFLNDYADAKIRVIGCMNFDGEAKKLIKEGRIEVGGAVDYLKLLDYMSEVDVNIAPLVINDFTNCKSELKFFEAGIVETTTIASPTFTFENAIKDGENGFLAKSGEWYDKLEYLYKHPKKNKEIAERARDYSMKNYTGSIFLKEVEKAYDEFNK